MKNKETCAWFVSYHCCGTSVVQIQVEAICNFGNGRPVFGHLLRLAQGLPNMQRQAKCAKGNFVYVVCKSWHRFAQCGNKIGEG